MRTGETTAICPKCGAWMTHSVDSLRFMSLRYELPCQRCGAIFRVGDEPRKRDLRYYLWWTAVHRAGAPYIGDRFVLE